MKLMMIKVIGLLGLFILTFIFTMLPLIISRKMAHVQNHVHRHKYQLLISLVSCFGGGVFLATCLLDLFPEVEEQLEMAFKKLNVHTDFPCAEFIVVIGFLLILTSEQIVLSYKESSPDTHPLLGHSHTHGDSGSLNGISDYGAASDDMGHSVHQDPGSHSSLRSLVLVLALSLHSIFEGLAIGFQPDLSQVLQILIAVLIHKCIIAFTLGLNLVQSKLKKRVVLECNIGFSLMSPLGMMIGLFVTNFDKGVEVYAVSGILQGIACGTFLYVTFFEVLPHELNKPENRLLKLLCVVIGFSLMSVLVLLLPG